MVPFVSASSRFVFGAWICAIAFARAAPCASTILVKQDGTGDSTTIQGGILLAQAGDTVLVFPGVYPELVVVDREIVLRSNDGCRDTVIDAAGLGGIAVMIQGPLTAATVFEGFSVRGGTGFGNDAGGIAVRFGSPVVRGNIVYGNQGHGMSAGIAGTPLFEDNQVLRNRDSGFLGYTARATLRANRFVGNGRTGIEYLTLPLEISENLITGNRIALIVTVPSVSVGICEIRNNTITRNREGVILNYFADHLVLRRNLITKNSLYGVNCASLGMTMPAFDENDVWGNYGNDYVGPVTTPTDISLDPMCCAPPRMDYHLHAASPCVLSATRWIGAFGVACP
jgi:nitrous oxidase accessory protein NosD